MRGRSFFLPLAGASLFLFLAFSLPAVAQDEPSPEEAARLEREAAAAREDAARLSAQARARAAELDALQRALVDAARDQNERERAAFAAQDRLDDLALEEARLVEQVEDDREALRDVFAALIRLERARPPAALAAHGDALSAARAARLLAEVAPAIDVRADTAVARLDALVALRDDIAAEQAALSRSETELEAARSQTAVLIDGLAAEIARLQADSAAAAQAADALAARAASLRELIAALAERREAFTPPAQVDRLTAPEPRLRPPREDAGVRPAPVLPATGRFADARGALALPAAGEVVAAFGRAEVPTFRPGVLIRTRPRALVTAPFDARVEFAGDYGAYGTIVILDLGGGYYMVLGGLGAALAGTDRTVLAGEPVAEMPDLAEGGTRLYLELWKDGQTIDPAPWWRDGG